MAQLSNRYATAMFNLAIERGNLDESLNQAVYLRDVIKGDDCKSIITHPRISLEEKKAFFDEVFKDHINIEMMGFLHLVVDKGRTEFIVPILEDFIDMGNDHLGKITALVVSAVPLREEQLSVLAGLLSRKLNKQVDVDAKVDPLVIGGLYVRAGNYYVDRTIKYRLQEMKSSMADVL